MLLMNQGFFWFPIIFSPSLIRREGYIYIFQYFGLICERLSQHLDAFPMDCRRCPTDLAGVTWSPGCGLWWHGCHFTSWTCWRSGWAQGTQGTRAFRYLYLPFQINPKIKPHRLYVQSYYRLYCHCIYIQISQQAASSARFWDSLVTHWLSPHNIFPWNRAIVSSDHLQGTDRQSACHERWGESLRTIGFCIFSINSLKRIGRDMKRLRSFPKNW